MTSPAVTLTVQQIDHLAELREKADAEPGDGPWTFIYLSSLRTAAPALLATIRRQQAALDAVTELADAWDLQAEHERHAENDYSAAGAWEDAAEELRTALASPAPTEATT